MPKAVNIQMFIHKVRQIGSPLLAVAGTAVVWSALTGTIPRSGSMSLTGLLPTLGAGLVGGLLAALIATHHKVTIAVITGVLLDGGLVSIIFFSGNFPLRDRNPIYWYWPAWFIPAFAIGGLIGSRFQRDV